MTRIRGCKCKEHPHCIPQVQHPCQIQCWCDRIAARLVAFLLFSLTFGTSESHPWKGSVAGPVVLV